MARVHVAQMGARLHFTVPLCHQRNGDLAALYTDIFIQPDSLLGRVKNGAAARFMGTNVKRMLGRGVAGIPPDKVFSYPLFGIQAWAKRRKAVHPDDLSLLNTRLSSNFAKKIVNTGSIRDGDIVWSFTDFTLELHESLQSPTIRVMDQCLAARKTYRLIMAEEGEKWEDWAIGHALTGPDPLEEKQQLEWESSNLIVAPSDFVKQSLLDNGVPARKIVKVPYCVDTANYTPRRRYRTSGPLNVLFAGEVGLRKGAHYLLQAAKKLGSLPVNIRLIGGIALRDDKLALYQDHLDILGPVPRSEVALHHEWADIFVLPSLVEGSAQVIYEALSSGLPVVCTPNAGAPITHGVEGQVIEPRNIDALIDAIANYIRDPELLERHSLAAINLRPALDIQRYQHDISGLVKRAELIPPTFQER